MLIAAVPLYQRREKYPLIFAAAALTALAQPSSGAVERAFSHYRNLFDVDQQSMYWDEDSGKILQEVSFAQQATEQNAN